ncbi:hypothetical protein K439DRAFT_493374 [Ramaria rubella]|nr:hypothetical protein K439DRAFT_493374 [Ramaria rubella]
MYFLWSVLPMVPCQLVPTVERCCCRRQPLKVKNAQTTRLCFIGKLPGVRPWLVFSGHERGYFNENHGSEVQSPSSYAIV